MYLFYKHNFFMFKCLIMGLLIKINFNMKKLPMESINLKTITVMNLLAKMK